MKPRRQLISYDQAVPASKPLTRPCSDCPFGRGALPGWLGSLLVDEWLQVVHGESLIECHTVTGGHQCAGAAIYRANVIKTPRTPGILILPADRQAVFATPAEFRAHHTPTRRERG